MRDVVLAELRRRYDGIMQVGAELRAAGLPSDTTFARADALDCLRAWILTQKVSPVGELVKEAREWGVAHDSAHDIQMIGRLADALENAESRAQRYLKALESVVNEQNSGSFCNGACKETARAALEAANGNP